MERSSKKSQLGPGMLLSYINVGLGVLVPVFYTPVMLSLLGQSEYGLYKLAGSTTSYLSLMAFGVGSAVTRYLIRARTEGGAEAEANTLGLFCVIFRVIAALTAAAGVGLVLLLGPPYGGSLTAAELARMRILTAILAANMAVSFLASAYSAAATAHERFVFIQTVNILTTAGVPLINLALLLLGFRSVALAVSSLGVNVLVRGVYAVYVRRALGLRPRYAAMPSGLLREILAFSFWVFVGGVVGQLYNAADMVIIGATPSLAAVGAAVYSLGYTFPNLLFALAQVTPGLFMPAVNRLVFSGASDGELTDLVIRVGRLQAYIVALTVSGFIAFGRPFLEFYAGPAYRGAYAVAVIVMVPNCVPLVQSAAHSVLQAKNMHRFRSLVYLAIAALNVALTIPLVRLYGVVGAAIPTGGAYLLGNGLILNLYYHRRVGLDIPRFWRAVGPVFALAAALCAVTLALSRLVDFYRLPVLAGGVAAYTVVYAALLWLLILRNRPAGDELRRLLRP